jgi:hypothetical protein
VLKSVASPPRYELSMSKLTIFSWGYWGWGNATQQLVQLVDSIEATRGFNAPVFVDIRISRSVRARGFNANAFGRLLGDARYRHMPLLGNLAVLGNSQRDTRDSSFFAPASIPASKATRTLAIASPWRGFSGRETKLRCRSISSNGLEANHAHWR